MHYLGYLVFGSAGAHKSQILEMERFLAPCALILGFDVKHLSEFSKRLHQRLGDMFVGRLWTLRVT